MPGVLRTDQVPGVRPSGRGGGLAVRTGRAPGVRPNGRGGGLAVRRGRKRLDTSRLHRIARARRRRVRLAVTRGRRLPLLRKERCSKGVLAQLGVLEQANRAVHAVVARLPDDLLPAQPRDRLGDERRRRRRDVFERERVEQRKLRPEPAEETLVVLRDPLALRADLVDLGEDLGQRDQALHGAGGRGRGGLLAPVGQVLDAVHDPDRQRLAAHRTQSVVPAGLAGRQADVAVAMPVEVVLALLGEELQRASVPLPRLQRAAQREVVELGVEDAHLAPQLLRRVGVGVRHQPEPIEGRHPPVHRRVRRKAGLDREDVRREVPVAVVDGVEAGLRAERGEPRSPDVGGNQV